MDLPVDDRRKTEKELGEEKVGRLLLRYSLPAIVAMTAASFYSIIDRIFIGQGVGPYAIAGLALTLPLMNLAIAFGAMVGVGAATLTSIRLGEGRPEEAEHILGNTVVLNAVLGGQFVSRINSNLREKKGYTGRSPPSRTLST